MKRRRLKTLLANDINLYGWHLPLDAHPELGNNAQLAHLLGINVLGEIEPLVPWGELSMPVSASNWPRGSSATGAQAAVVRRYRIAPSAASHWCTGGGQSFIDAAARWRGRLYHRRSVGTNYSLCPRAGPAFLCRRPPRHRAGRHSRPQRMAGRKRPIWMLPLLIFLTLPDGERRKCSARCYLLGETAVVLELEPPVTSRAKNVSGD